MKTTKGEFTIVNTDVCQFKYADYVDYCEMDGVTPEEEDSEGFWDWCRKEADVCFEADMENIKYCKAYNVKVRLNGSIGAWDSHYEIKEYTFKCVYDAIEKCNSGNYDRELKVVWRDGIIYVSVSHHDGVNCFEIRPYDRRRKLPYLYNN